jgi:hypothetical protein
LEKIRAIAPAGVFDEVSARARAAQEEEFVVVYGDAGAAEYVWNRGWVLEKKEPGLPARTVVLKGCERLSCEGSFKRSLSMALGDIAASLMDVSTIMTVANSVLAWLSSLKIRMQPGPPLTGSVRGLPWSTGGRRGSSTRT